MKALNNIRGALDTRLLSSNLLPYCAMPNVAYNPDPDAPFIKVSFVPVLRRPAVRGLNPMQRYDGLYTLLVCTPEKQGNGAGYEIAENLLELFEATTDISFENPPTNFTRVTIDFSEVSLSYSEPPFYCTPVTVGWYLYI